MSQLIDKLSQSPDYEVRGASHTGSDSIQSSESKTHPNDSKGIFRSFKLDTISFSGLLDKCSWSYLFPKSSETVEPKKDPLNTEIVKKQSEYNTQLEQALNAGMPGLMKV
ncbi:MAG: hypothetical protein GWP59_00165 [Chlamydiales bacterium]|nr:hypothetical protein [Chlamydiales bacterium]NCF70094.1 hypothetical protein [Chlamydiales bacterium]